MRAVDDDVLCLRALNRLGALNRLVNFDQVSFFSRCTYLHRFLSGFTTIDYLKNDNLENQMNNISARDEKREVISMITNTRICPISFL